MKTGETSWRKATLPLHSTLGDVIRSMNLSALRIVLVVSPNGVLEGTISDGDIRSGLLGGLTLASPIETVIHRNARVVTSDVSSDTVIQLMVANKLQQIPVVDEQQRVIGLHIWDEVAITPLRANKIVVMAGGRGTRLRPITDNCPKPMVTVAGKPILEHIVERAKREGFKEFVLAIHYLGHIIEEHFGDGSQFGVHIEYLHEDSPLGTAGALSLLQPRPDSHLIVANGDVVTDIRYGDLLDFHLHYGASATMAVRTHEWQHPFGVVRTDGVDISGFEEKPITRSHINAGVYALSPFTLEKLEPNTPCDMPALFERLRASGMRTVAYPMHEPWLDVGRPDDLEKARSALAPSDRKQEKMR